MSEPTVRAEPARAGILIPEYCVKCRGAIGVISPTWYRIDWDYHKGRITWRYAPDDTALCVACCLEAADDAMRPVWAGKLDALQARKSAAGLPDNVTMFHHRSNNTHVYGRVRGVFQFDHYFVHHRGTLPDDCTLPRAMLAYDGQPPFLTLLHVGFDVSLDGIPAVAQFAWSIDDVRREGVLIIDGWRQATHPELMRLMEGARIFYEQATIGRPRGTMSLVYDDYVEAFQGASTNLGRPPKSLDEFLEAAPVEPRITRDTLKRNFKRWGVTWRAFRREQVTP